MSHVDEGVLHAYLDGGLSALDAVRVERHVADCGACRQRLDQGRALIQRAARLLEWASPPADRAAPPLADLRPAAGGAPRWRVPVAWAATIVIALGAGIYGGQLILSRPERVTAADAVRDEPLLTHDRPAAPITVLATAESVPRRGEAKAAAPAVTLRDSVTPNLAAQAPPAQTRHDSSATLALDARRDVAPTLQNFNATPPAAANDSAARARRAFAPEAAVTGAAESRMQVQRASAPVWPLIAMDSARALLATAPVSIPDFPVTAIRTLNGVVAVEQVVPPGRVIRLLQRRGTADEEQERAAGDLLARYMDGLRVEISGPMAVDSLSRLLERARAMP